MFAPIAALLALAATPTLDQARTAMKSLQCRDALELAAVAERSPTLTVEERQESWWIQARCAIALGEHRRSELALGNLLRDDPSFVPSQDDSPKVREAVEQAREQLYPKGFVKWDALPSSAARQRFRLVDPFRRVAKVELVTRVAQDASWIAQPLSLNRDVAAVDEALVRNREWFLRGADASGAMVVSAGDEASPNGSAPEHQPVVAKLEPLPEVKPASSVRGSTVAAVVMGVAAAVAVGIGTGLRIDAQNRYERSLQEPFASDVRSGYQAARDQTAASVGLLIGGGVLAGVSIGVAVAF